MLILPDFPVFFVLISDPDSADFPIHRHVLSISRKNALNDSKIPIFGHSHLQMF